MDNYVIYTDSACDVSPELLSEWGVSWSELTFRFNGEDKEYLNYALPAREFYDKMRGGGVAKTSAVNISSFESAFEEILRDGKDILYIGFSTGLSTTCNSAAAAAKNLGEKYPERRILTLDTRSASLGFGMLVWYAKEAKADGADIDECYAKVEALVPALCHWFTVEDLVYLKRGGRISAVTQIVGNMLGIKPVLHMDDLGHLVSVSKARGRRGSIAALCDRYKALVRDTDAPVFISHGDCEADAFVLRDMIEKAGGRVTLIQNVGPVIGAHAGPGVLALFFVGKER
ncbi:MAG: DegV family protein [Clostridia bacterium]|nr:DegV family protein [Clostridia bacterium]